MTEPRIPYGWHDIDDDDVAAVVAVMRHAALTQGVEVEGFEAALADYCGAAHAVAANSGTAALLLACRALGVGPASRVWTSPLTFVASAACALHLGAEVDFVDIDPRTGNLDPALLEHKLLDAERRGRLPDVVIPVHYAGRSCDMARIRLLGDRFGYRIIEDACHALGGHYRGAPIGDCRHSDVTVFSFHPVKSITTGEGGMAMTGDSALAAVMRRLCSHGVTRAEDEMAGTMDGGWYYEVIDAGYNFRLTDIQAALGRSQLRRLDDFIARRRERALQYHERLAGLPLVLPPADAGSAWHLYVVRLADAATRRLVYDRMRTAGIGVNVHYVPLYRQPLFRRMGFDSASFPQTEHFYAGALTLPLYPGLTEAQQARVCEVLADVLRQ